jgi:hypothetical protein
MHICGFHSFGLLTLVCLWRGQFLSFFFSVTVPELCFSLPCPQALNILWTYRPLFVSKLDEFNNAVSELAIVA